MSTGFFYKKITAWVVGALSLMITLSSMGYAFYLSSVQVGGYCGKVYFLVRQETNVQAGAYFTQWEGGAGYLLTYKNTDYVAISAYCEETDGIAVQSSLCADGQETRLLALAGNRLYFKTCEQKRNANVYVGALQAFYGYLQVFERGIALLEQSTQERAKAYYASLEKQLQFMGNKYEGSYPEFAKICKNGVLALREMSSQTLYVKDLRYLLCELSEKYASLAASFSL